MVQVDSSSTAIGLLFNAAKVLADQQTKMSIESVHFMDGLVHLNMRDILTGDDKTKEEDTNIQHTDINYQLDYDLVSERYTGENNNYSTDYDP
ncbi:6767_t:CDS:1, partial [Paraglomus brasilianum]